MDLTATQQTWEVQSFSSAERIYIVRRSRAGAYSCSCPDFTYRCAPRGEGYVCKHIQQVLGGAPDGR